MKTKNVNAILERRIQHEGKKPVAFPSFREVVKRLSEGKLRLYNGIDATDPHLHIGHTIPLLLLKNLAEIGHEVIVLLGDFTSRIGDPTGKMAARTAQSEEQVERNLKTYVTQIEKIIPKGMFNIRRNSEWLGKLTFSDVAELAAHVTVQQMLSRDMFQKRVKQKKPIHVSEFLYPLMQGYDSVAMEVDGEVGGNDQTFNMLVGRDLLRAYKQKNKIVLPCRLLVDPQTGRKISKSEGGFIALDDKPEVIFEKVSRNIPDEMLRTVFELCTEVPMEDIAERQAQAKRDDDWRAYSLELATELVRMYHGAEKAEGALRAYQRATHGEVGMDAEKIKVSGSKETPLSHILAEALGISRSEAKRLIEQKAVTRNGKLVTDARGPAGIRDGDVLRVGSHRPFRVSLRP